METNSRLKPTMWLFGNMAMMLSAHCKTDFVYTYSVFIHRMARSNFPWKKAFEIISLSLLRIKSNINRIRFLFVFGKNKKQTNFKTEELK